MDPLPNFINGKFVKVSTTSFVDVVNPANGEIAAKVPLSSATDVDEAVKIAKAAFPAWSGMTIKQRAGIMFNFHHLMNKHADELASIIVRENGKNRLVLPLIYSNHVIQFNDQEC